MPFFFILILIIVLPLLFVFLFINGAVNNIRRTFNNQRNPNVKHQRHFEKPITEAEEDEIEYSEDDIIEAEFEEIENEEKNK